MPRVLGAGPVADAFFVAFRLPNLFRSLFAEGAFNSAFVPLFTKNLQSERQDERAQFRRGSAGGPARGPADHHDYRRDLHALAGGAASRPGFGESPEKFDLAVLLTRITFPYLLCMSLTALRRGC